MELAALSLKNASAKLYICAENLALLFNGLEPAEGRALTESVTDLNSLARRLADLADKLGRSTGMYRAADKRSAETAESLPAAIPGASNMPGGIGRSFTGGYTVSQTIPAGLYVEDWLLSLIYTDCGF